MVDQALPQIVTVLASSTPDKRLTVQVLLLSVCLHCRGDYNAALAAIVDALPLQTRQTVIQHCRWHADLCELDMRK
jgi:hypothetical protein